MIESLEGEIRILRSLFWSDRDPDGRGFAPLADAYRRAGDVKQAIELLNDGLDRHRGFSPGHVVAARLYAEQGLFAEAEIAARNALEIDAENLDAIGCLIVALEDRGEVAEAKALRSQLSMLEPEWLEEATADFGALAPDEPAADDDVIVDFGALAPDEPESTDDLDPFDTGMMSMESPENDVLDVEAITPDEPEADAASGPETPPPSDAINTRTMAALYASQGLVERAADVYRHLLQANPGDEDLQAKLSEVDPRNTPPEESVVTEEDAIAEEASGDTVAAEDEVEVQARELEESGDHGHDVDTPFAWTEHDGEAPTQDGPTMGDFFSRLLNQESNEGDAS